MRTHSIRLALIVELLCPVASAQWVATGGPYTGLVSCLAVSGTDLFAGAYGGIFLSTDNGGGWSEANAGLTNKGISTLYTSGTKLFAGTLGGVFLSTNNGTSWSAAKAGLTDTSVRAIVASGTNLFAGTGRGVFLSTNDGTSWSAASVGLPPYEWVNALTTSGTYLFAGLQGSGAVFRSTNNGTSWSAANTGFTSSAAYAFATSDSNLFAGATGGVFRSTNNGTSWSEVNTGLINRPVNAFATSDTNLFVGLYGGGVFLLAKNDTSWSEVNTGLTNKLVVALAATETYLFAGTNTGVWRRPLAEMITSDVGSSLLGLPTGFSLSQNYPNPFNPTTTIRYELSKSSMVRLSVYDILGRELSVLVNERKNGGSYEVKFDAARLASGVYFYKLQAGDYVQTRKLLILK